MEKLTIEKLIEKYQSKQLTLNEEYDELNREIELDYYSEQESEHLQYTISMKEKMVREILEDLKELNQK